MTNAFVQGFRRATLEYKINQMPTNSGPERQRATEIDAEALRLYGLNWAAFAVGNRVGMLYCALNDYPI